MTKVVVDSFDTHEQAVAFVDWLHKQFQMARCRLVTTEGVVLPQWDGVDQAQTNNSMITFNIAVYADDDEEY